MSELVSNALRHGAPPYSLAIRRWGDGLQIEVHDHGAGVPQRPDQPVPSHHQSGRGLLIIDALAAEWGYDPDEPDGTGGKSVWFRLVPRQAATAES